VQDASFPARVLTRRFSMACQPTKDVYKGWRCTCEGRSEQ